MKYYPTLLKTALLSAVAVFMLANTAEAQRSRRNRTPQEQPAEPTPVKPEPAAPAPTPAPPQPKGLSEEAWREAGMFRPGMSPSGYDSLVAQWYEQSVMDSYEAYFKQFVEPESVPEDDTPDSVYIARLRTIVSPIHMGFNEEVRKRISNYTRWKGTMAKILGLSQLYFPMIEAKMAEYGLPLELKLLSVVESALNPTAISRAGAAGLWQFMYSTGRQYGLEITTFVDQRFDPVASTDAACRFLRDLYNMYGDWTLALAAYNCGPGNVNKAISRAGGSAKTFWDVYPYLPRETRGYVPLFIAITYAYNFHSLHGIEPSPCPMPISSDTVYVDRITHLDQMVEALGIPKEVVYGLNPQYKEAVIPAVNGTTYPVRLPQTDVTRFIESQEAMHETDSIYLAKYINNGKVELKETASSGSGVAGATHVVKSGDTLGAIARKYGVTVNQLKSWNNISNPNALRIGQRIRIYK